MTLNPAATFFCLLGIGFAAIGLPIFFGACFAGALGAQLLPAFVSRSDA